MENKLNLAELTKDISNRLLETKYLLDIMEDIIDGESKLETLHKQVMKNIISAFHEIEECRQKIYILD
ncbi:hypothetical protein IJG72_05085 [bacterium]|nr:hypothetical protein [bacterium]